MEKDTVSEPYILEAIKDLKQTDNRFIVFNVHYRYDDGGVERKQDVVLLVYWRSKNMCKDRMSHAGTSNYIKSTLVCGAYLEIESIGDLSWDVVVDACQKKKK